MKLNYMASPADYLDCFMYFPFRLNECKNKIIVNAGNIFTIITLNSYIHKLINDTLICYIHKLIN